MDNKHATWSQQQVTTELIQENICSTKVSHTLFTIKVQQQQKWYNNCTMLRIWLDSNNESWSQQQV